ncbi:MAG: hypothetical protein H6741_25825 [Alphaproteobacteria bacterium]|nr:hypothetical protein [Alphaproteobacteria bacterium]MCB9796131.1 hypothetical protein [Alphaproteobacteria bacterium]
MTASSSAARARRATTDRERQGGVGLEDDGQAAGDAGITAGDDDVTCSASYDSFTRFFYGIADVQ